MTTSSQLGLTQLLLPFSSLIGVLGLLGGVYGLTNPLAFSETLGVPLASNSASANSPALPFVSFAARRNLGGWDHDAGAVRVGEQEECRDRVDVRGVGGFVDLFELWRGEWEGGGPCGYGVGSRGFGRGTALDVVKLSCGMNGNWGNAETGGNVTCSWRLVAARLELGWLTEMIDDNEIFLLIVN
jgi:hypothetical protein